MLNRREFHTWLGALGLPAAAATAHLDPTRLSAGLLAELAAHPGAPGDVARDEDYWGVVQRAFAVDRSLVNFNNGGVSPAPGVALDALERHLRQANHAPAHVMWHEQEPRKELVRERLARVFGCDAEEVALTRNASEGLQICQLGLDLEPGDEVLTTNQDYPRMINTFLQRERREGIVLRRISLPVPATDPSEVVARFERAITERTRAILMCHVINLTGQVLPVREVVAMARARGVPVIVDGAHALAHLDFRLAELDCDYYATSLHKWLSAPVGTGLLHVRRERIAGLWPMMAAPESMADDVRKFEEIGTHPVGLRLAVAESLTFHESIGAARKLARLVHLRDLWARRLAEHDRVRLHTSLEPGLAGGIATFGVDGLEPHELQAWLWREHRILTTPIAHEEFSGIRVSPGVYATPREVERFGDAVERALRDGL